MSLEEEAPIPAAVARIAAARAELARREVHRAFMWSFGLTTLVAAVLGAAAVAEFDLSTLWNGLPRTVGFFADAAPNLEPARLFEGVKVEGSLAYWWYAADDWVAGVWQSIEMAVLATVIGAIGALVLGLLAASPTSPNRIVHAVARRTLELFRTIPDIVLALVFVFAFGIGPPAGVLAIAIHTTGALGKLFAEAAENIDRRPLEGVRAAGGSLFDEARFGAIPQVAPNFASYALLRFEINVASASAIGFVGAGGVGEQFIQAINFGALEDAFAILLLVIAVIFVIDLASEAIRHRLIGLRP